MQGSIERRGNSWRVRVSAPPDPVTGKRRQLTGTAKTEAAAKRLANRLHAEALGTVARSSSSTFATLWANYWATAGPPTAASRYAYESAWRLYLEPALGKVKLRSLTRSHFLSLWSSMAERGLSPGTADKAHTVASAALSHGVNAGWITSNPAKGAGPAETTAEEVDPIPSDQLRKALALSDGTLLGLWLWLAATTGARRGELCALQWGDFDMTEGRVFIRRRVTTRHDVLPATKNGKPRSPYLPAEVWPIVEARRLEAEKAYAELGAELGPRSWVFSKHPGSAPWWPDSAGKLVLRFAAEYGIEGLRPHRIRHHAVTQMLARGVDVRTVAEIVGASPTTLLRTYAHYVPTLGKAAAELLAQTVR